MKHYDVYFRSFKLGSLYNTPFNRIVKFIKVTPKGYNLLDIKTNKCIMRHHLYSRDFSHKQIPEDKKVLNNIAVPNWLWFKEIQEIKTN